MRILKSTLRLCCATLLVGAFAVSAITAEDWTRFRGDNGTGISDQKGIPVTWSPGDYAWNIELPGVGHASPIIIGERLFVTSAEDEGALRYLFCLNAKTGEENWRRVVGMSRSHKHIKGSWASSTPTTDGSRVFVAFADAEHYRLAAYDFAGELLWRRSLGTFESQHGQGVSPIVFDGMVILANDQDGPSSVMAFDAETGDTVWSVLRASREVSYATPFILQDCSDAAQLIVSCGKMGITSLDPNTGRMNWKSGELPLRTVGSPVYGEGLIFQSCGGGGVGKLLVGVDPGGSGDVSQTHVRYRRDKELPYVPSPVVYEGHLFLWNDKNLVSCVEIASGTNVWTKRIDGGGGNFSSSPICIDGKLYCVSEKGDVVVLAASPEYEFLGRTSLGDPSHATPSVANGRLYLRTYHRLACLKAETPDEKSP